MGKRSDFKRIERDYYRTFDERAGKALLPFIKRDGITKFIEPFAGAGDLVDQFPDLTCLHKSDIEPQRDDIQKLDAFKLDYWNSNNENTAIITNTPWRRDIFHNTISYFTPMMPLWLLIDANYFNTKQAAPYISRYCTDIVVIGRLKWIPDTNMSSKDDCVWARFTFDKDIDYVRFHNRRGLKNE